jgi:hypothetical protein
MLGDLYGGIMNKIEFDEVEMVKLYESGISSNQLAKKYGCDNTTLLNRLKKNGVKIRNNTIDLVGQIINDIIVIKQLTSSRRESRENLCKCHCGREFTATNTELRQKRVISCGCIKRRKSKEHHCWKGHKDIPFSIWQSIKKRAESKNLDFNITIEYLWEIWENQEHKCALTGEILEFSSYYNKNTASLDRIDSKKGYVIGNVEWVHSSINAMKQRYSKDYFINMCKKVSKFNK